MPELPEVETIRIQLLPDVVGKKITRIEVLEKKQFIGDKNRIINQKIIKIDRKGKVLFFELSNHNYLSFHLKMTGEILFAKNIDKAVFDFEIPKTHTNKLPNKFTRIIIVFSDNSGLFFNDLRKFGWVKTSTLPEVPKGTDILSPDFDLKYLSNVVKNCQKPIKIFLLDQEKLTGLGNIYANDSLWQARINPTRITNTLSDKETNNLYKSIKYIIGQALKHQGSSGADEMYVKPDASKGNYQYYFKVYQREKKGCRRCKTLIKRIKQAGRSTFYCENCQK